MIVQGQTAIAAAGKYGVALKASDSIACLLHAAGPQKSVRLSATREGRPFQIARQIFLVDGWPLYSRGKCRGRFAKSGGAALEVNPTGVGLFAKAQTALGQAAVGQR